MITDEGFILGHLLRGCQKLIGEKLIAINCNQLIDIRLLAITIN